MRVRLVNTLALLGALLAALPPGACCVSRADAATVEKQPDEGAPRSCCHHRKDQPASQPKPTPPAARECCCHQDAVPVSKAAVPDDHATGLVAAVVAVVPQPSAFVGTSVTFPALVHGPPLRLLQCVWLC